MKRNLVVMMAVMFILMAASLRAEDTQRQISVTGTVETKTAPDQIIWSVTLTDTDKDMRAAMNKNDEKIRAIVALRNQLKVDDEDMDTGTVSIQREYERGPQGARGDFKHYLVRRNVTIRQRDLKRFDEFLDLLIASSEMEMSFRFESSKMEDIRAETRLKAVKVAKDKAQAMAEVVGSRLGKALNISENSPDGRFMESNMRLNNSFIQGMPSTDLSTEKFIPGAISVKMTVYATFELK